jgi:hypothetical protein
VSLGTLSTATCTDPGASACNRIGRLNVKKP